LPAYMIQKLCPEILTMGQKLYQRIVALPE